MPLRMDPLPECKQLCENQFAIAPNVRLAQQFEDKRLKVSEKQLRIEDFASQKLEGTWHGWICFKRDPSSHIWCVVFTSQGKVERAIAWRLEMDHHFAMPCQGAWRELRRVQHWDWLGRSKYMWIFLTGDVLVVGSPETMLNISTMKQNKCLDCCSKLVLTCFESSWWRSREHIHLLLPLLVICFTPPLWNQPLWVNNTHTKTTYDSASLCEQAFLLSDEGLLNLTFHGSHVFGLTFLSRCFVGEPCECFVRCEVEMVERAGHWDRGHGEASSLYLAHNKIVRVSTCFPLSLGFGFKTLAQVYNCLCYQLIGMFGQDVFLYWKIMIIVFQRWALTEHVVVCRWKGQKEVWRCWALSEQKLLGTT